MRKKKPVRSLTLQVRLTEWELNRIKGLAGIYAGGNLSLFVVHASLNAPREKITNEVRKVKKSK